MKLITHNFSLSSLLPVVLLVLLPIYAEARETSSGTVKLPYSWISQRWAGSVLPFRGHGSVMGEAGGGMMIQGWPFRWSGTGLSGFGWWSFNPCPAGTYMAGLTADWRIRTVLGRGIKAALSFSPGAAYELSSEGSGFRMLFRASASTDIELNDKKDERFMMGLSLGYTFLPSTGPFSSSGSLSINLTFGSRRSFGSHPPVQHKPVPRNPETEPPAQPAPNPSPELKDPAEAAKPEPLKMALAAEPLIFTPDGDGINDTVTLTPIITGEGKIIRWRLIIRETSENKPLYTIQSKGHPPESIVWDGNANGKEMVRSAERYSAELKITTEKEETLTATAVVSTGILVVREGGILRIMVTGIVFPPDSADFGEIDDPKQLHENKRILDEVAAILKKFSGYSILIEGHANRTVWWDAEAAAEEEREELLPLSLKRAELVARNLEVRGIAGDRITTVGKGSSQPLYPFSDTQNNWKNRRVEFILLSQQEDK